MMPGGGGGPNLPLTLQTAFLPQISAYHVNLNTGYRKLF